MGILGYIFAGAVFLLLIYIVLLLWGVRGRQYALLNELAIANGTQAMVYIALGELPAYYKGEDVWTWLKFPTHLERQKMTYFKENGTEVTLCLVAVNTSEWVLVQTGSVEVEEFVVSRRRKPEAKPESFFLLDKKR